MTMTVSLLWGLDRPETRDDLPGSSSGGQVLIASRSLLESTDSTARRASMLSARRVSAASVDVDTVVTVSTTVRLLA